MSETLRERIESRLSKKPSGCWEYSLGRTHGYGHISVDGKARLVHKVYYEILNGEVPEGLELDHVCCNRICANPDHLEAVTHQENMRRWGILNRRSHCKRGHPLTAENMKLTTNEYGSLTRYCYKCRQVRDHKSYLKRNIKVRLSVAAQAGSGAIRTCRRCKLDKSLDRFEQDSSRFNLCKECHREVSAQYRKSAAGREYIKLYGRIRYQKFKHKAIARAKVSAAIKKGTLIKPTCCSACLTEAPIFGHHEDYDKPLEVIWLCRPCHMDKHGKLADKSLIGKSEL